MILASACGTPRLTRWASSITPTTWSGWKSDGWSMCKAFGFDYKDMEKEDGAMLAVAEAHCRYAFPARFDDEVIVTTWVAAASSRMVTFGYEMKAGGGQSQGRCRRDEARLLSGGILSPAGCRRSTGRISALRPAKHPSRQRKQRPDQFEYAAHRDANDAEGQQQQPDDGVKHQRHDGQRPAENQEDVSKAESSTCSFRVYAPCDRKSSTGNSRMPLC